MVKLTKKLTPRNKVRIIGGKWRGRVIQFPPNTPIKPSPDRVRETLFNWLAHPIVEALCLDLFAGSGIIGFEAISRGAQQVVFIDNNKHCIQHLYKTQNLLKCTNTKIVTETIPQPRLVKPHSFDIVFLDPPFYRGLIESTCAWLENDNWINHEGLIYIEAESTLNPLPVPSNWRILKTKTAGLVGYHLLQKMQI